MIAGRSDATLNRGGVRLGTAEFYRVVEELPEVVDSLVVHLEDPAGGNGELLLFVQLAPGGSSTTRCAAGSPPRCAPSCRRGTSRTGSLRCRWCRATGPARSWSCRSSGSCSARALDDVASRDVLPTRRRSTRSSPSPPPGAGHERPARCCGRHRGDRGQLGGALPGPRPRRRSRPTRRRSGGAAASRRRGTLARRAVDDGAPVDSASPDRLAFTPDAATAVAEADFVQENGPERQDVKLALFALLDEAGPTRGGAGVQLVGSATQRHRPGLSAAPGAGGDRAPVQPAAPHPAGRGGAGEQTSEEAVAAAMAFYTAIGKRPIRLRQELPGHVANRLQAALWQEAYSLVDRGVATVADIDTAIAHGPGLRWAVLGPFANQHLSGGPGRHRARPRAPRPADRGVVARPGASHAQPRARRQAGGRGRRGARGHRHRRARRPPRRRADRPARRQGRTELP